MSHVSKIDPRGKPSDNGKIRGRRLAERIDASKCRCRHAYQAGPGPSEGLFGSRMRISELPAKVFSWVRDNIIDSGWWNLILVIISMMLICAWAAAAHPSMSASF